MKSSYHLSHRMRGRIKSRRTGLFAAAMLALTAPMSQAAVYTWGLGNTGGNWAVSTDWAPTAPATGPTTGDTANLNDVTTGTRVVVYDTAASGSLGTLNFNQTDAAVNELQLAKSLTLASALMLGATGGGSAVLDVQNNTLTTSTLTINSGGTLLIGLNAAVNSTTGNFITGNTMLSGGTITTNSAVGTGNGTITETNNGSFTMTSGTLNLTQSSTGGVRFSVNGGVTITGGTINYTGTNAANGGLNEFYMSGTTNNVIGNAANPVTITTAAGGTGATGNGAEITLNNNGNESLSYNLTAGSAAFDLHNRSTLATGTTTHVLTYTGTGAGPIGALYLNATNGAGVISSLQLGSDLRTVAAGTGTPILAADPQANNSTGIAQLDLNGHTLNGTAVTGGLALASRTGSTDAFAFANSSTTTAGTLQATSFNFNAGATANARVTVGANVVLQATGTALNDFRVTTPTTSGTSSISFDPASTFSYTGTAASVNTVGTGAATTLGKVVVGDGTNASALTMASNLTTAGTVTINNAGTLIAGANTLTTPSAGVTINGGGALRANLLNQTLLNQLNSGSGSAGSLAYLNLSAGEVISDPPGRTETVTTGGSTLNFSTPGLTNVSLGTFGNVTLEGSNGDITPANSTYQLGSPTSGTLSIFGTLLSGANNLVVNGGIVRVVTTASSYTGTTTINAGTLSNSANTARLPTGAFIINTGGTFDLGNTDAGTTQTIASLAGAGTVTNSGTSSFNKILLVNGSASTVFSGTITDTAGAGGGNVMLTRSGTGTLTLSGTSNYAGGTSVTGGTLLVNGPNNGAGAVALSGGTLGGTSSIAGALTMTGGTITGGTLGSVGMLTLTSAAALNAGTYQADISGATSDRLVTGGLALNGAALTINGTLDGTTTYDIASYVGGTESGTFSTITGLPSSYTINYAANGGTEIDLVPVPEPATWVGCLFLVGGVSWQYLRRRRASVV